MIHKDKALARREGWLQDVVGSAQNLPKFGSFWRWISRAALRMSSRSSPMKTWWGSRRRGSDADRTGGGRIGKKAGVGCMMLPATASSHPCFCILGTSLNVRCKKFALASVQFATVSYALGLLMFWWCCWCFKGQSLFVVCAFHCPLYWLVCAAC